MTREMPQGLLGKAYAPPCGVVMALLVLIVVAVWAFT
jgi:hypothetical protein